MGALSVGRGDRLACVGAEAGGRARAVPEAWEASLLIDPIFLIKLGINQLRLRARVGRRKGKSSPSAEKRKEETVVQARRKGSGPGNPRTAGLQSGPTGV